MTIVRTSCSRALAYGGNKVCETLRSDSSGETGWFPVDDECTSPNASEPDSASLHKWRLVSLPDMVKPATGGEVTDASIRQDVRGDWGERVQKELTWYPGDPYRKPWSAVGWGEANRGSHNPVELRWRKSERPIGAKKEGNACGAKGLPRRCVYRTERSAD